MIISSVTEPKGAHIPLQLANLTFHSVLIAQTLLQILRIETTNRPLRTLLLPLLFPTHPAHLDHVHHPLQKLPRHRLHRPHDLLGFGNVDGLGRGGQDLGDGVGDEQEVVRFDGDATVVGDFYAAGEGDGEGVGAGGAYLGLYLFLTELFELDGEVVVADGLLVF